VCSKSSRAMSTPVTAVRGTAKAGEGVTPNRNCATPPFAIPQAIPQASPVRCSLTLHRLKQQPPLATSIVVGPDARACTRRGRRGSSHPSPSSYRARCASRPAPSMTHPHLRARRAAATASRVHTDGFSYVESEHAVRKRTMKKWSVMLPSTYSLDPPLRKPIGPPGAPPGAKK
jgi:hypothetical protein